MFAAPRTGDPSLPLTCQRKDARLSATQLGSEVTGLWEPRPRTEAPQGHPCRPGPTHRLHPTLQMPQGSCVGPGARQSPTEKTGQECRLWGWSDGITFMYE